MLHFEGINYIAVFAAWIINVMVGAFWYSPAGFGKLWSKLSGVDIMKTPKKETNRAIQFVSASSLVMAFILALILSSLNATTISDGVMASFVLWLGFTALTTVGNTLYQRQSWKFWWLNASYFLVVMVVNGAMLAVWN